MNPSAIQTRPPFRRRTKRRSAGTAAPTSPLMATGVPYASFNDDGGEVVLEFNVTEDSPLASVAAASPEKWWARFGGKRYDAQAPSNSDYNTINILFDYASMEAGANEVGYTNSPSDISDTIGRQLAAFTLPLS